MRPLRVAILGSASALLTRDDRDALFEIVDVARHGTPPRNLALREEYDRETAEALRDQGVDYVFLAGYPYIVTRPLLATFPDRLLALHDGDLTILDEDGQRRYRELHATRRAVFDGDTETRSSLFFATERLGAGPLLLLSGPFAIAPIARHALDRGDYELAADYARIHRRWMIAASWGEMLAQAIRLLAAGTIAIIDGIAWVDGVPGPCRLGEAPRFCDSAAARRGIPASCPFIQS